MQKDKAFYTCYQSLLSCYDHQERRLSFRASSVEEYNLWAREARQKLIELTGINTSILCNLTCREQYRLKMDGYTRVKAVLATEADVEMPMYILIPDGIKSGEKRSCVIAPHGHGGAGKESVAGVRDDPETAERINFYNCDYGLQLVQQGYVVFCPDARGSGERREWAEQSKNPVTSSSCNNLSFAAISLGKSLTGMWTWDLMRLIDHIETLDYCDAQAIGCCGFSGGGLQTLWLAALDDRVKCAVISGYFHSYRDSMMTRNLCGCNFVPNLWEYMELGDIGALIAPRPLLIESGDNDPLNGPRGLKDVDEQLEKAARAYSLFGKNGNLKHFVFEGKHQYNGGKTAAFFKNFL